jgi:hypothetical protein
MDNLQAAIADALGTLRDAAGLDGEALFGERSLDPEALPARAAHAFGIIEGAAIALGITPLELLDEIDAT